jgi:hypothetical protein
LYFFPLPNGQGWLRPTFVLRAGVRSASRCSCNTCAIRPAEMSIIAQGVGMKAEQRFAHLFEALVLPSRFTVQRLGELPGGEEAQHHQQRAELIVDLVGRVFIPELGQPLVALNKPARPLT